MMGGCFEYGRSAVVLAPPSWLGSVFPAAASRVFLVNADRVPHLSFCSGARSRCLPAHSEDKDSRGPWS